MGLFFTLPNEDVPRAPGQTHQDQQGEDQPAPRPATPRQPPCLVSHNVAWCTVLVAIGRAGLGRLSLSQRVRGVHHRLVSLKGPRLDHVVAGSDAVPLMLAPVKKLRGMLLAANSCWQNEVIRNESRVWAIEGIASIRLCLFGDQP